MAEIFSESKCSSTPLSPKSVAIYVEQSTDISNKQVALNVLSMAAEYLKKSCKLGDYYDIMVFVDYKSNMNPKIAVMTTGLRARNLDKGKLTWGEYRNLETERQELERRQLAEQQARQAARDRIVDFIKHSGATNWLTLRQLSINPFQFDGKKIIIHAYFMKMLSREEALFHWSNAGVVLSGVPSSVFTSENEPVLLVGVVRGIQAT